jgi:hypothetical protein
MIQEHVHRGPGHDGHQLLQEFDGLEEDVRRAIAPDRLERDEDAPVEAEADAVLGECGVCQGLHLQLTAGLE